MKKGFKMKEKNREIKSRTNKNILGQKEPLTDHDLLGN